MKPGWTEVALGDVATIERRAIDPDRIEAGVHYIGLQDISSAGAVLATHLIGPGDLKSQKFRFDRGHVLFGKLRPNLAKITTPDVDGVCSTDILPIRPGDAIEQRFLLHHLRRPASVAEAARLASGANLPRISPATLLTTRLPLPPIEEQRRIAAVLDTAQRTADQADAVPDLTRAAIAAHLANLASSIDAAAWPSQPLGEIVDPQRRITRGIDQPGPDIPDGVPYIKTTDFARRRLRRELLARSSTSIEQRFPRSRVRAGDLVMCIRATVGPVLRVTSDLAGANLSRGTALIAPGPDIDSRFLLATLEAPAFQARVRERLRGATFLQLPLGELASIRVSVPPIEVQRSFAAIAEHLDAQLAMTERRATRLTQLFASLQDRAFRGDL